MSVYVFVFGSGPGQWWVHRVELIKTGGSRHVCVHAAFHLQIINIHTHKAARPLKFDYSPHEHCCSVCSCSRDWLLTAICPPAQLPFIHPLRLLSCTVQWTFCRKAGTHWGKMRSWRWWSSAYTDHRQPFVVMNRLTVINRQMSCSLLPPLMMLTDYKCYSSECCRVRGGD